MSKNVDVEAQIVWETDAAWKISNDKATDVWIPKHMSNGDIEIDEGDEGWAVFTMPEWFAVQKGLI